MTHKLAVKAIIRRSDGKILIVKRSDQDDHLPGVWETVGGGVEEGTTPQEALMREIAEEVNLSVVIGEPFNVFSFTKDNGEFKIGITFLCAYLSGEVKLSEEHSAFAWIEAKDFKDYKSAVSLYDEIASYADKFSGEHERFVVSQKGLIIKDDKCLIVEIVNRPGIWDLPGGRIDNNENKEGSFRRELEEELGLKEFKVLATVDYDAWQTQSGFAICGIASLVETDQDFNLSQEHTRLKWISESEINEHEFVWPAMGRMIKNGFEYERRFGNN